MKVIREKYSFTLLDSDMESNNEPSMTIPDQSLTIPQILERYVSGIELPYGPEDIYDDDDPDSFETDPLLDPAFDLVDVTEAQETARLLKERLESERKEAAEVSQKNEKASQSNEKDDVSDDSADMFSEMKTK